MTSIRTSNDASSTAHIGASQRSSTSYCAQIAVASFSIAATRSCERPALAASRLTSTQIAASTRGAHSETAAARRKTWTTELRHSTWPLLERALICPSRFPAMRIRGSEDANPSLVASVRHRTLTSIGSSSRSISGPMCSRLTQQPIESSWARPRVTRSGFTTVAQPFRAASKQG